MCAATTRIARASKSSRASSRSRATTGPIIECDKCGGDMQLKTGRFGKFFGCTNADLQEHPQAAAQAARRRRPSGSDARCRNCSAQKVEDHYMLRDGAAGLFLAASLFPRNRETRAPLVMELLPHKARARSQVPVPAGCASQDPDGNRPRFASVARPRSST